MTLERVRFRKLLQFIVANKRSVYSDINFDALCGEDITSRHRKEQLREVYRLAKPAHTTFEEVVNETYLIDNILKMKAFQSLPTKVKSCLYEIEHEANASQVQHLFIELLKRFAPRSNDGYTNPNDFSSRNLRDDTLGMSFRRDLLEELSLALVYGRQSPGSVRDPLGTRRAIEKDEFDDKRRDEIVGFCVFEAVLWELNYLGTNKGGGRAKRTVDYSYMQVSEPLKRRKQSGEVSSEGATGIATRVKARPPYQEASNTVSSTGTKDAVVSSSAISTSKDIGISNDTVVASSLSSSRVPPHSLLAAPSTQHPISQGNSSSSAQPPPHHQVRRRHLLCICTCICIYFALD